MANEQNLKPIRDSKTARELQEKSVEKRKQNDKERKLLKELLIERTKSKDLDEMLDNLIKRAKHTDKGFEVYRVTLGQKPTDTIEGNVALKEIVVEIDE
jgi:hypothetical protein